MKREDNILSDAEHLYAEDLAGKEVVLTVKAIEKEEVKGAGGRASNKYTFHFTETPKKYIPGITVRRSIVAAVGSPDKHAIIGKRLRLYPTTCDAFGQKSVPCIRFKGLAAAPTGKPTGRAPDDFVDPPDGQAEMTVDELDGLETR